MSFLDDATAANLPADFQPHALIDGDAGTAATGLVDDALIGSDDDLLRHAGLDPKEWMVTADKKRIWSKETPRGNRRSIFFGFVRRTPERERLAELLASKIEPIQPVGKTGQLGLPLVVCLSDFQCGKVDERGGSLELSERFETVLGRLARIVEDDPPEHLVILDVGDAVENHSSHTATSQVSTNDLTIDQQLRLWQRMLTQTILTLAPFAAETTVSGVPSNHGEVRVGGQQVGYGDYGIGALGAVADAFRLINSRLNVRFIIPDPGEISTTIKIGEAVLVAVHGHQAKRIENMPQWIAGQAATPSSPFARATIIAHGHYHHAAYNTSRGREIISCPTFDAGSRWLRDQTGEWSPPGLACFRVKGQHATDLRFLEAQ